VGKGRELRVYYLTQKNEWLHFVQNAGNGTESLAYNSCETAAAHLVYAD
jgi:hypothetical protein